MNIAKLKQWFKQSDLEPSTARIVEQSLVLSLPDANEPCVWRTDLKLVQSAVFSILEKENVFVLVMQDGNKKAVSIAEYENKDRASKALRLVSKVLMYGESGEEERLGFGRGFIIFLAVFVVIYMILSGVNTSSDTKKLGTQQTSVMSQENSVVKKEVPKGVPVLLDDVLEAP